MQYNTPNACNFITDESVAIDFSTLFTQRRKEGLGGFLRVRNEGEYLAHVIDSWLPVLDEMVVVYNGCTDNTEEVLREKAKIYGEKLRVYHYLPHVHPQGSRAFFALAADDVQSLVAYYNYALTKTTRTWAIKIDGDIILAPAKQSVLRAYYEKMSRSFSDTFLPVAGVNLCYHKGQFYVPSSSKFCGTAGDLCLFPVSDRTFYRKGKTTESLHLQHLKNYFHAVGERNKNCLFAYYHMKFVKRDLGFGNYDFATNPHSHYYAKTLVFLRTLRLLSLAKVLREIDLPLPSDSLAPTWVSNTWSYKKQAWQKLMQSGGVTTRETLRKEWCLYRRLHKSWWQKIAEMAVLYALKKPLRVVVRAPRYLVRYMVRKPPIFDKTLKNPPPPNKN